MDYGTVITFDIVNESAEKCAYLSYGKVFYKELLTGSSHPSIKRLLSVFGRNDGDSPHDPT
jgi:hypothetical protein